MATTTEYRSLTDEGMLQQPQQPQRGRGRGKKHSLGGMHSMGPVTTTTSGKSKGRPRRRKHDRENTKQKVKHSVIEWLRNNYMLVEEGSFAKLRLFYEYQEMCKEKGIKPTTNSAFGKLVHCAFPGVQCNRKGPRGNAKHHYKNLAPRPNGSTPSSTSSESKQLRSSRSNFDDDEDNDEVVEEEVVEEESEEESEVEDSSESSSEEDGDNLESSTEACESRPGSVVGNPLVLSPGMTSPVPFPQQQPQQQPQGQLQFVPLSQVTYAPINDTSSTTALYLAPTATTTTEYPGMQAVGSATQPQQTRMVPRALHSAVAAQNPYAPMIAHASRPQPVYSAGYPAGYFQAPLQVAAPAGPVPVLAATNSPFVPFNPSVPVMTLASVNTAAVPDYALSSPELCPAAMEVPLMDELNFGGWESVDDSLVETECEGVPGTNYFKPLVNTESYALLRFKQQQRRRKQRRSQFLFQQLEQMQEEKQKAERECISPSADVDHSVALDDDFWDWVSEFVSKDKQDGDSALGPDSDPSVSSDAAAIDTTIPNEWETDFGTANDLEKFLNNP